MGPVHQRHVEQLVAIALEQQVVHDLGRCDTPCARHPGDRTLRRRLVVDRVLHREHLVEAGGDLLDETLEAAGAVLADDEPTDVGVLHLGNTLCERQGAECAVCLAGSERVERCGETEQHADRPGRHLVLHIEALGGHLVGERRHLAPAVRQVLGLLDSHRQRTTNVAHQFGHHVELGLHEVLVGRQVCVGDQLDHALADLGQCRRKGSEFVHAGEAGAERGAVLGAVDVRAARGEAEGTRFDTDLHLTEHLGEFVAGRGLHRVRTALAHHVRTQRCVRHLGGNVHCVLTTVECVEIIGEGFPIPREALGECRTGDVLHTLEHRDEERVIRGLGRGEAHAAVAHHERGDAVDGRRGEKRVPRGLTVVVGVDVHEPGGDEVPGGIECALGLPGQLRTDLNDSASGDGDIGLSGRCPCAVDNRPALDQQIEHGLIMPHLRRCG